jgi:SAM-dependent methyltransferase
MSNGFSKLDEDKYCVVGPKYVLRSIPDGTRDGKWTMTFHEGRSSALGSVSAVLADNRVVQLRLNARGSLAAVDRIEVIRLFARVCVRRFRLPLRIDCEQALLINGLAALLEDGFEQTDATTLVRGCEDFHRRARAESMESVYEDAFHIPWNFVPQELDVLDPLLEVTPERRPNMTVLDLGCGSGKNAVLLEGWGFQVFGIDLSVTAIARCRSLVADPSRFMVASVTTLPFSDNFFDAVLDVGCLHCLEPRYRVAAAAEVSRVLTPGGVCYSRLFRPRSAEWLAAQPFVAQNFGVSDEEALSLFPSTRIEVFRHHPEMIYLKWTKPC